MEMLSDLFFERSFTSVSNDSNDGASWPYNYNKEQSSEGHYKDLENQLEMGLWSNLWFPEWDVDYNKEQSSEGHYKDLENQLEMEMLSDLFFERSFTSVSNDSNDGASWPYNYNKEQNSEDHYKDLENQQKMEREIYLDDPLFPERDVVRVDEQPTRPSSYELVRPDLGIKSMSSGMRKYEEEFRKKSEEFNELHPLR